MIQITMTLNSIMNLICRFICIAYVTVRSYDTSFFKVTFFIVIDVIEQFRDVCSIWVVSVVKKS